MMISERSQAQGGLGEDLDAGAFRPRRGERLPEDTSPTREA